MVYKGGGKEGRGRGRGRGDGFLGEEDLSFDGIGLWGRRGGGDWILYGVARGRFG